MWKYLRCHRLAGVKFRRQAPMFGFIADFWAPTLRLVVEVDGGYHEERAKQDAKRDRILAAHGIKVLRFKNEEVFQSPETVCEAIRKSVIAAEKQG